MTDRRGTLWAAILGSGIVFLDSSVLTVALPRIARDLPAHVVGTLEGESYVYNGYLLGESAFLILAEQISVVDVALDRKSTRLNSSHANISYAVFCLKKKMLPVTRIPNECRLSIGSR